MSVLKTTNTPSANEAVKPHNLGILHIFCKKTNLKAEKLHSLSINKGFISETDFISDKFDTLDKSFTEF